MTGAGVVFAKDWMVNDCCCHESTRYQIEFLTQRRKERKEASMYGFETSRVQSVCRLNQANTHVSHLTLNNSRFTAEEWCLPCQGGEDQGQYENQEKSKGRKRMKRLLALILVWTLLVITGTLVSADGQTRRHKSTFGGQPGAATVTNSTFKILTN